MTFDINNTICSFPGSPKYRKNVAMLNGDLPSKPPGLFLDTLETIVTQKNIHAAVGEIVTFKRPDGKDVSGYLASPANADGAPAIVVIQEWWGLNDQIRGVADRLATAGYVALVPDLYRGEMTVEQEEAQHLMSKLDFADAATQDIRGAVLYLNGQSRKVGVTGFCMGGALTLLSLNFIPELAAGVVFYGLPPLEYLDPKAIKVPVQAHWATQDEFFSTEDVDKLEAKLIEGGVDVEFHRYLAHHAFANETAVGYGRIPGTQYDPVWAQLAYDRTLTFFGRTMWG
ncbi:MAG: dienelactone hydrolase family protein [Pseudomonas sp.]